MSTLKRKAGAGPEADSKKAKTNGNIAAFFGGSASKPVEASAPTVRFNKAEWVKSLTADQKDLLKLEIETIHDSWLNHLKDDITTKEFLDLKRFLKRETAAGKKWFPPAEDVYSWSRHTPFNSVKVVILGQDPYHNVNQAHGMAFSVRPPTVAPPSLKNMYIALKKDYPSFAPPQNRGGLLTPWADRGVLMLNTCLTVRAHEANSHSNHGWERFTQRVIDLVAQKRTRGVVFMAWGTPAGKRVTKIDKSRHLVLTSVHPSPLSAARGFFDCGHFRKANEWLVKRYGNQGEVDWALAPGTSTKENKTPETEAASSQSTIGKEENKAPATKEQETKEKGADLDDIDSDEEAAMEEVLKEAEKQASQEG